MNFWRKIFKKGGPDLGTAQEKRELPAAAEEYQGKKEARKDGKIGGGVLRAFRITEKTSALGKRNWYVFSVEKDRNKMEVKRAVEGRYGVKVERVRIAHSPGKVRRRGRIIGWKPGFKKAMVKVKEGQSIEMQ